MVVSLVLIYREGEFMPFNKMHENWEQENDSKIYSEYIEKEHKKKKEKIRKDRDCSICDTAENIYDKVKEKISKW